MKLKDQVIFWMVTLVILVWLFSSSLGGIVLALYFVTLLFPIIIGTSVFFNQFLVPKFLRASRKLSFIQYFLYMIIVSVYLELLVMMMAFVILADYQIDNLGKIAGDIYIMTVVLYLVVFINGFIEIFTGFRLKESILKEIERKNELEKKGFLLLKVDRKNIRVPLEAVTHIESLSDYVQVHLDGQVLVTKEKISNFEQMLPDAFIRIHRSFVINSIHVASFTKERVVIGEQHVPIGRKYKDEAATFLAASINDGKTTLH